jgi:hypothetical protein
MIPQLRRVLKKCENVKKLMHARDNQDRLLLEMMDGRFKVQKGTRRVKRESIEGVVSRYHRLEERLVGEMKLRKLFLCSPLRMSSCCSWESTVLYPHVLLG